MEPDTFPSTDTVPVTDTDPVTNTDLGTDTVLVTVNDVANTIPVIVSIPTTTTTDVSIRDSVPVPYGRQGTACTTTEAVPGKVQVRSARWTAIIHTSRWLCSAYSLTRRHFLTAE